MAARRKARTFTQSLIHSRWPWFVGVFLLIGLLLLGIDAYLWRMEWRFRHEAVRTYGTVRSKWTSKPQSGNVLAYYVSYDFRPKSGTQMKSTDEVSYKFWQQAAAGDEVDVFYLEDAPKYNHLSRRGPLAFHIILLLVGVGFTAMGTAGEYFVIADARQTYYRRAAAQRT